MEPFCANLPNVPISEPGMPPEASLPLTVQLGPAELDNLIERLEEAAQVGVHCQLASKITLCLTPVSRSKHV